MLHQDEPVFFRHRSETVLVPSTPPRSEQATYMVYVWYIIYTSSQIVIRFLFNFSFKLFKEGADLLSFSIFSRSPYNDKNNF